MSANVPSGSLSVRRHRVGMAMWLAIAAFFLVPIETRTQSAATKEYQLKAAFLFNFAQFVEWPADAFTDAQSPLVIGVIGEDPFGPYLDEIVRGEKLNNRALTVQRFRSVEDIGDCHILFISRLDAEQRTRILTALEKRKILTVGETDDFAQRGGMVQFFMDKGKIRLRINHEAAKGAGLTISSKLLRLADIVTTRKE